MVRPVLAMVAVALLAVPAAAQEQSPLRRLTVEGPRNSVAAAAGSGCQRTTSADGSGTGACADFSYPLETRGEVDVRPGERLTLIFEESVVDIHVDLRDGRRVALAATSAGSGRRFSVQLPAGLATGAHRLGVFVRYDPAANPTGDQDFEAALRVPRDQSPTTVPVGQRRPPARARIVEGSSMAAARLGARVRLASDGRSVEGTPFDGWGAFTACFEDRCRWNVAGGRVEIDFEGELRRVGTMRTTIPGWRTARGAGAGLRVGRLRRLYPGRLVAMRTCSISPSGAPVRGHALNGRRGFTFFEATAGRVRAVWVGRGRAVAGRC